MTNKMEYILLAKKPNVEKSDKEVKADILGVFGNMSGDVFCITVKRTEVRVRFNIKKRNMDNAEGNAYYLTLTAYEKRKGKRIEALEIAHKNLMKNSEIRKAYHVITLFDDVSSYYCIKAYYVFHEYEKQIRRLIYKYLIMNLGAMWVDKTVSNELKSQVKERMANKNDEKLIAEILHEMDMSQLEKYLFDPIREVSATDVVDNLLSEDNIERMTKEEIASTLQSARPQSLWDKYFATHISINCLQEKMDVIRINRNKVAHCKPFYSQDYSTSMKILKDEGLIEKLTLAIDTFETKELNLVTIQDVAHGLAEIGKFIKIAAIVVSPALAEFARFIQGFRASVTQAIVNPLIDVLEQQRQMYEIATNPTLTAITEQAQAVSKALGSTQLTALTKQSLVAEKLSHNSVLESMRRAEELNNLLNTPLLNTIKRSYEIGEIAANIHMQKDCVEGSYTDDNLTNIDKDNLEQEDKDDE